LSYANIAHYRLHLIKIVCYPQSLFPIFISQKILIDFSISLESKNKKTISDDDPYSTFTRVNPLRVLRPDKLSVRIERLRP